MMSTETPHTAAERRTTHGLSSVPLFPTLRPIYPVTSNVLVNRARSGATQKVGYRDVVAKPMIELLYCIQK